MKKMTLWIVCVFMACAMLVLPIRAQDEIRVMVDGAEVSFDVLPQMVNDRTMVPFRKIFEALDAEVSWDSGKKMVTAKKDNITVEAVIGSNVLKVNNEQKSIDAAPVIVSDRTLVPVRFVSESLGCDVDWNEHDRIVAIATGTGCLEVHYIDVGQADSIFIKSSGKTMLIDGGNKGDGGLVCRYLDEHNIDYLDYVLCTHGHEDHVGGLPEVLENVSAGKIYVDKNYSSQIFESFFQIAESRGIPVFEPVVGESLELGKGVAEILAPIAEKYADYNDNSIVIRLDYGESSFLFTGDAGEVSEGDMLSAGEGLDVDVLKVGHHGSRTASSDNFLSQVTPEYCIISCGAGNSYGHPHEETLNKLYRFTTSVYRTDENGNIVAYSDGNKITLETSGKNTQVPQPAAPVQQTSAPVQNETQEAVQGQYIGNKNTKKLHVPTCGSLPLEKNRSYFNSIDEAISQGYEKCSKCF